MIGIPIILIIGGYFLWRYGIEHYEYNVFGTGVLIRLFIALAIGFFNVQIGIILFIIFSIYNFIITLKNTSFFIAFSAIIFQPVALYFAIAAINRLLKEIND